MKVEFIKAAQADGVHYAKGDDADLRDGVAQKLISRGYAKAWSARKKKKIEGGEDGDTIRG